MGKQILSAIERRQHLRLKDAEKQGWQLGGLCCPRQSSKSPLWHHPHIFTGQLAVPKVLLHLLAPLIGLALQRSCMHQNSSGTLCIPQLAAPSQLRALLVRCWRCGCFYVLFFSLVTLLDFDLGLKFIICVYMKIFIKHLIEDQILLQLLLYNMIQKCYMGMD